MQEVIRWENNNEIELELKELISKGYKIVNVVPIKYSSYTNYSKITKALIIVINDSRKEKLEKLKNI